MNSKKTLSSQNYSAISRLFFKVAILSVNVGHKINNNTDSG